MGRRIIARPNNRRCCTVSAAKYAKEIWSKLWVSLLSAPIIWAITIYYSKSISAMFSEFDWSWYNHYWYLVLIAGVMGVFPQ
jgi:hypothetical protein